MSEPLFKKAAIIGMGLIGSSMARAMTLNSVAGKIVGFDRASSTRDYIAKAGFVHESAGKLNEAVAGADLVILAVPPGAIEEVVLQIKDALEPGAIVTDTASVKLLPVEIITKHLPESISYVPAHPIAGSEKSGPQAGDARLFSGKQVILTPANPVQDDALLQVMKLWDSIGAQVEMMPAELHDMVYGYVSHLPQALAYAVMTSLLAMNPTLPASEGFHRFVRLAGSNPTLWVDIFLANNTFLLQALDKFSLVIKHINSELASDEAEEPATADAQKVSTLLFPRLIASCTVLTANLLEQETGVNVSRFAGSGFADFTAPAHSAPDNDIEAISKHYQEVAGMLSNFTEQLDKLHSIIESQNREALQAFLACANQSFQQLLKVA